MVFLRTKHISTTVLHSTIPHCNVINRKYNNEIKYVAYTSLFTLTLIDPTMPLYIKPLATLCLALHLYEK